MILGTGSLAASGDRERTGVAMFPVRGEFPMVMDCLRPGDSGWEARLRVGSAETNIKLQAGASSGGKPVWTGDIMITGYAMRVVIKPGWAVEFSDN